MKRLLVLLATGLVALLISVAAAATTVTYTLTLTGQGTGQYGAFADFSVHRSVAPKNDSYGQFRYTPYVVNTCYDSLGNITSEVGYQVLWGVAGSLDGTTGDMPTSEVSCEAVVTVDNNPSSNVVDYVPTG